MTKATTTQVNEDALHEALDSVADAVDAPDFDQKLSRALDEHSDAIVGQPAKPAKTPRKRASGRTSAAAKKIPPKATSARSQAAPAKPKAQPDAKRPAKAPDAVCERIAQQLRRVKLEVGVPMRVIAATVGLTSSQVGRSERGGVYLHEVERFEALFAAVDSGEIQPERKARQPKTAEVLAKLDRLGELVRQARDERAVKARTALLDEALDLITTTTSTN